MKGLWGFLVFLFLGALAWTVVTSLGKGMDLVFTAISVTWSMDNTGKLADVASQILLMFGFVFVLLIAYTAWTWINSTFRIRFGSGASAPRQPNWTALPTNPEAMTNEQWAAAGNAADASGGWSDNRTLPGAPAALPAPQESAEASWYALSGEKVRR